MISSVLDLAARLSGSEQQRLVPVQGDERLFDQYGAILVNPKKHPSAKTELGQRFVDWLISDEGQAAIGEYAIDGEQLFFPNAERERS